jgi:hypothetical protein
MSRYRKNPVDLGKGKFHYLSERKSLVYSSMFAKPYQRDGSFRRFMDSLPDILAARDLRKLAQKIAKAKKEKKPVIMAMGAHPIKCGLSPILISLVNKGIITGVAVNGAVAIHDIEVALEGHTSEDVATALAAGTFGMTREPGELTAKACSRVLEEEIGLGEALGAELEAVSPRYGDYSLLLSCYRKKVPVTIHIAIGTDTVHLNPTLSPKGLGEGSHRDFRLFISLISEIPDGGVYLNVGSAVVLPEVFLKAVAWLRNQGVSFSGFTVASLDFIRQYRVGENVLKRPALESGESIEVIGHHELTIPLLSAMVTELLYDAP